MLMKRKDVVATIGLGYTTVYNLEKKGLAAQPVDLQVAP